MKWILAVMIVLFILPPAQATNGSADMNTTQIAPVVVNGEVLFHMRGITAYPAKQRAKLVAARIKALAENESFDPNTLKIEDLGDRSKIKAGDQTIVTILDVDAELEGVARSIVSRAFLKKSSTGPGVILKDPMQSLSMR